MGYFLIPTPESSRILLVGPTFCLAFLQSSIFWKVVDREYLDRKYPLLCRSKNLPKGRFLVFKLLEVGDEELVFLPEGILQILKEVSIHNRVFEHLLERMVLQESC